MFNFIFEGKLGEILAPVTGASNTLFLAIQHQKNSDVHSILLNSGPELARAIEGGYAAIHVACRYNNNYALDLIMSKGIPADFPDASGNTPMHYAAKYGNMDLVKILLERGCSPAKRNAQGQTPYDVASGPIIRQFLLPIQLQFERSEQETNGQTPGMGAPVPGSIPTYGLTTAHQQHIPSPVNATTQPAFNSSSAYPQQPASYGVGAPTAYPQQGLPHQQMSHQAPQQMSQPPQQPIGVAAVPSAPSIDSSASGAAPGRHIPAAVGGSGHLGQPPGGGIHPPVFSASAVQPVRSGPLVASANASSSTVPPHPAAGAPSQFGPAAVQGGPLGAQRQTIGAPVAPSWGGAQPPLVPEAHHTSTQPGTLYPPPLPAASAGGGGIVFMNPVSAAAATAAAITGGGASSRGSGKSSGNSGRTTTNTFIQPDGFHSSASDPELKAKYGHKIEIPNLAPPPTGLIPTTLSALGNPGQGMAPPPSYAMMYGASVSVGTSSAPPPPAAVAPHLQGAVPPNVYNRYVAYDPYNQSPLPLQAPFAQQQQQQSAYAPPPAGPTIPPVGHNTVGYPPQPALVTSVPAPNQLGANASAGLPPRVGATPVAVSGPNSQGGNGNDINVNVFNPATDCDVTTLDASSSSVL